MDQLDEPQRDFLLLTLYTDLRRNECRELRRGQIDLVAGILGVPVTKNGKPHTLPISPMMREVLERRCARLQDDADLFVGVSADHVHSMAMRLGSPRFMLHDLRKLLATVGERLGVRDAALRRTLNHTSDRSDVQHRHYVQPSVDCVRTPLELIQHEMKRLQQLPVSCAAVVA